MNTHTRKRAQYISLAAVLCLLAAGLWLAAPALAGTPLAQTPPAPATPAAPATPVVAPAPAAAPAPPSSGYGVGYAYGYGEGSGSSYLGIDVRDVTPESAKQLKLREERGAEITMVDQDAPAGKAGFKEHDVILDFDGQKVEGVEQLRRMIHETPAGRTVTIGYSRDGQVGSLKVQLANRAEAVARTYTFTMPKVDVHVPRVEIPSIHVMTMTGSRAGLLVSNVTPQLGEYFGCKNGECVLVQSVEKGSAAEAAGFKAGDAILKVENERVTDLSDWRSALRAHRNGGKIAVTILRERREQTLSLTLPAGRDSGDAYHFEMPGVSLDMEAMARSLEEAQHSLECAQGTVRSRAALDQVELQRALERAQREYQRSMKEHGKELKLYQKERKDRQKELQKQLEETRDMYLEMEMD